ncbi:MAG: hypothetical protein FD165_2815 [Gammaproteobacteria bacterium]|nr:MAG: hypothetical protein FD165_2815 [Gammaproteobacteria bacterium]
MTRKTLIFLGVAAALLIGVPGAIYAVSASFDDAVMDMKTGRYAAAKPKLERLAMIGHSRAQHLLGEMYAYGWNVPRNRDEAIRWFRRAAYHAEGLSDPAAYSAYYVGKNYAEGLGVQQDSTEAEQWFQFAKQGGYIGESAKK